MSDAFDMSTPVTRGELREELGKVRDELRTELRAEMRAGFEQVETRFGELETRLDRKLEQRLAPMATKADLEIWGGALLERMTTELARHARAFQEAVSAQISVLDDKYKDLPGRVSRLENKVFPPE